MNRWKSLVIVSLAALVAGAAALVYARDGDKPSAPRIAQQSAPRVSSERLPEAATPQTGEGPNVHYDPGTLPEPAKRMLSDIILAAQSGNIEAMRPVLESNELKPMVAAAYVADPIKYWKEQSVDGTGRDVLAAMLNMIASGFVLTGKGHDAVYVWPYFAEVDITKLTPEQEVEFYRAVPPEPAASIKKSGKYTYYRLGISPSGVWHYFVQ